MPCTTIAVIHQPRWETLELFDDVVLLATGGLLVYAGPVVAAIKYFEESIGIQVPPKANPADVFLDTIGAAADDDARKQLAAKWAEVSAHYQHSASSSQGPALSSYHAQMLPETQAFLVMYQRAFLQMSRAAPRRLRSLALMAVGLFGLLSVIDGSKGIKEQMIGFGMGQLLLLLLSGVHALWIFGGEKLERLREESAGIGIMPYFLAKDICHLIEVLLFGNVFACLFGPLTHVPGSPVEIWGMGAAMAYYVFGLAYTLSTVMDGTGATMALMLLVVSSYLFTGVELASWGVFRGLFQGTGWLIFMPSPLFWGNQHLLYRMLFFGTSDVVRDTVCNGLSYEHGITCYGRKNADSHNLFARLFSHSYRAQVWTTTYVNCDTFDIEGNCNGKQTSDDSFTLVGGVLQLALLGCFCRAFALFRFSLRRGAMKDRLRGVTASFASVLMFTCMMLVLPMTPNYVPEAEVDHLP
eukprot:gnl/MRDRNA2_/MRDRNA2_356635_c0_seq1.p1 gnl/MRDRNA2_/MRDRNA2_356635_c0~~gnl/MRDRNA2_/MRDRNA2_356635_c0_seq1.p1  ORF type:complete len:468 (+),score=55.71 gnl/MRDRNA2_/MRDRNA2_356635_c0_seq1:3-1406(+)